ncbi:hypothetical protein CAPTEDRAFT_206691 [Capitella teleta]|uniref:NACHT domain-containing protein n=1 Tax=Capitella teleta TaxID=283909 RepID=R7V5X5_CAPTE|nr:hypothetical protein CAPTEDRAFT_206691 [Capitella teleta]|eukprot:ELU14258.1 hypothetical protein CAPTEDRAFT_206691 [Capitella teleta]
MDFSFIFLDVREQLVRCYSRLRHISTAPEWTQEFALDSAVFYISLHLQKGETATTQEIEFSQEEIFAPHQEEKSSSAKRLKPCNPKRILVEGDPGMGKTTLCQNLAFRWGHEECTGECKCAPCVHSWTLVVYLTAANLKGFTDIHTAIRDHLLRESSIEEVKAALKSSQSNTLFIIDSYDEGFKDNVLLHDLIEGRVYANATLLLTSRPNYLEDLLKKAFDSELSTYGFNREQKRLYVTRFANSKKENESKFEGLLDLINDKYNRGYITSLCSNPLNLAIICLLICSDGLPNITNRTELYKSITKFLVKKASERMHRPKKEIEADIIRPICRLSFEAYKRNEVSLSKVDLKKVGVKADDVLQSGFLTKKVKVSLLDDPVERFSFSHKTFLEYLAAKHLAQTPDDLKDWLQTFTALKWEYEHGSLKSFVIDLLPGDFVETLLVIMECFTFSHETNAFRNFPTSYLLLELLRHLKAKKIILSPEMKDEFKEKCHSIFNSIVHNPIREDDYIRITFATINQNAKPRDISMNLDTEAEHVVDYLRNLKNCPMITLAIECADESVANESSVADAMQRGLQGSFFNYAANQLSSNIPLASYKEDPTDFLRIALEQGLGNDIQGMEHEHSNSNDNLCELIEKWTNLRSLLIVDIQNRVHLLKMFAAIAKCQMLNTLEIHDTEIGDDVIDLFLEMLKSLKQLESLHLRFNKLSADGKQKIKDLAQQREKQLSVRFGVFD